jgi:hypothetical protein
LAPGPDAEGSLMSERRDILRKPVWRALVQRPGVTDLPLPALKSADDFLAYRALHKISKPEPHDFVLWAETRDDPLDALGSLSTSMALIAPPLLKAIAAAQDALKRRQSRPLPDALAHTSELGPSSPRSVSRADRAKVWDPIAPPSRRPPKARSVSVEPHELPSEWQAALRRMARGLPCNGVIAPAPSIVKRMREKLCQLCWSARQAGLPAELSEPVLMRFEKDVRARSEAKEHGLRWATARASIEEVDRFGRYTGADEDFLALCRFRLQRLSAFENGQKALKFYKLLETGHTTLGILDLADGVLAATGFEACARKRHRMRNRAAILGIYPVAPLRNASAALVFGRTLLWEGSEWVIVTEIQKTQHRNPETFVYPLELQHGRFIDAVILGDHDPSMLAALRATVLAEERPLFVHHDCSAVGASYIARLFNEITGNSFTTLRTMLHTDLGVAHGNAGTEMAMVAAHQTSQATAQKYKAEIVARTAAQRAQERARRRRRDYAEDHADGELFGTRHLL